MINRTRVDFNRFSLLTRVVCFALCCALLLAFVPTVDNPKQLADAESVAELEQQKADLAAKQEELEAKRNETAGTLEEQKAQSEILRQQIAAKSEEIALNGQLIAELDTKIADKTTRIAEQEALIASLDAQITEKYETLRIRLRSISKSNTAATHLQLLFGSGNYTDYLISFKLSERISANDQQIMDSLESDMNIVANAKLQNEIDKAVLEQERTQLAAVQAEMEAGKTELQALYAESEALANQMAEDVEHLNEQIAAIDQQQQSLQSTIDDVLAQIAAEEEARRQQELLQQQQQQNPTTSFASGTMTWPAPTCKVITSSYKYRPQFGRYHKGIDIACYGSAQGQPIVAAADGTVKYANRYDSWGGGYGYHMIIDHGNDANGRRVLTVYAHCSEVLAYEGQQVKAGDLIGKVGNTGNSFGAHLHFEVQVGGEDVDPVGGGYLSIADVDVLG